MSDTATQPRNGAIGHAPMLTAEPPTGGHPKMRRSGVTWKAVLLLVGGAIGVSVGSAWALNEGERTDRKEDVAGLKGDVKDGFRGLHKRLDKQDDRWERFFGPMVPKEPRP